jgi:nitroreductase
VSVGSVLTQLLPSPLRDAAIRAFEKMRTRRDFSRDTRRYVTHAMAAETSVGKLSNIHLEAQLTRDYHRAEKGLTLDAPRRPFGAVLLRRLNDLLPVAEANDSSGEYLASARSTRDALVDWNERGEISDQVAPKDDGKERLSSISAMFHTRHSVRSYSARPVTDEVLREAVALARISPSVCNRSPWVVRLYQGKKGQEVLRYQNGNDGFGDSVPTVAVISVDLGFFAGSEERNQAFIEGGIFASSLMWALHGMGLDTCMLNLSLSSAAADALRNGIGMPQSEVPIMMMAVGYGKQGHRYTRSQRRPVDDFCQIFGDE